MKSSFHQYFRLCCFCAVVALMHACASSGKSLPESAAKPHQAESAQTSKPKTTVSKKPKSKAEAKPDKPASGGIDESAVIVLSGEAAAYREIAREINTFLKKPVSVYTLTGDELLDKATMDQLRQTRSRQMIAVGLRAAQALRGWNDKQIVFCQVVNHADHDLVSDNMKGVGALPSAEKLFADWKQLSPRLKQVLVVTGTGFDQYMEDARLAASRHGIQLVHQVVGTDREFLYAVKQKATPEQGHWVIADNRVLSVKAMREAIAFNAREAVQTVVFSPELLRYGGLFYVTPSRRDISYKVLERFLQSTSRQQISGDDIVFLDNHEMGINRQVARQLGLNIPPQLQTKANDI